MHDYILKNIDPWLKDALNNLYAAEVKLKKIEDSSSVSRNIVKIKESFKSAGLFYEDPQGQKFKETRTDLEVTIAGEGTEDLFVVEVIKPIIRYGNEQHSGVVQKGIVIVESNKGV